MNPLVQELVSLGISEDIAQVQVDLLVRGPKYAQVLRSASIGDGVHVLSADEASEAERIYDSKDHSVKIIKFVPASGAATRMFKDLEAYAESGIATKATDQFFDCITKIPFYGAIDQGLSRLEIAKHIISPTGLGLAHMPKGSIPFHRYNDASRTAFEEHLVEGSSYALTAGQVHIHYTISAEHMVAVKRDMELWQAKYAEQLSCDFDIEFSIQRPATDTMAIRENGEAVRSKDNKLLMRPGGHGSLIHNLNRLDADIIFIKNIDNVVSDRHRADTIRYKKALGGMLIQVRREARQIILDLKAGSSPLQAIDFLKRMGLIVEDGVEIDELIRLMNRPYRVCGMVRNEGEPGGGPFWVNKNGRETLQIVESAEIDLTQANMRDMLDRGTHFNPVDLVCCLNDLYGSRKNLLDHVDMEAAFVTEKVIEGESVKVLEWPGLWNGAMSDWNSLFVEVPISTFNPVKTINDLLRPLHQ